MVRISVVVPVFNTAMYLDSCIAALKAQNYPEDEFEIIFVDNNSTDRSPQILAAASGIVPLHEAKQSSYAARNRGAREARGEILAFTDSDCVPEPGWLRAMEASLADPQVQVVLGSRSPLIRGGLVGMVSTYEEKKDQLTFTSSSPDVYYGYTNNMMIRRSIFERYGPFVERSRGADTIFVRRVVNGEGCAAVVHNPDARIQHAEMTSYLTYCKKMFIYGRSRGLYRHIMKTRPLSQSERWMALRACLSDKRYSPLQATVLIAALLIAMACWGAGSVVGRGPVRA